MDLDSVSFQFMFLAPASLPLIWTNRRCHERQNVHLRNVRSTIVAQTELKRR